MGWVGRFEAATFKPLQSRSSGQDLTLLKKLTHGWTTGTGGLSRLVDRVLSLSALARPRKLCMLLVNPLKPFRPSWVGLNDSCSSSTNLTPLDKIEGSTGVMTSPAARNSCGSSDVAVVEEWESEGYEDIRSITRCGGSMSANMGSEWTEDDESGEWSDISRR